jgi:hypothetical protein
MGEHAHAGGCLCGAVRYRISGPLRDILVCHCGQCRRWHGHLGAYTSAAQADITVEDSGALRWFASSPQARRGFCDVCGSSLFFEPAGESRLAIAAGSLDQPSGLRVLGHEYVADKADYVTLSDDLPTWPGDIRG